MVINWDEVQKEISPIKEYEDICQRLKTSFGFPFIHDGYNFSLPDLQIYTQKLLGEDPRGRYEIYNSRLGGIIAKLYKAKVENVLDLNEHTCSRDHLVLLVEQSGVPALEIAMLLKYLVYWVIPGEKYLSGLVRNDANIQAAVLKLRDQSIRTNLEVLQAGIKPAKRKLLVDQSGVPEPVLVELVNRADFSRMPWASKATISNIIGAGYSSIKQLANANFEQLIADFFSYGKSIGKNLKLGNEIESSYRIAKIIPRVLLES